MEISLTSDLLLFLGKKKKNQKNNLLVNAIG